MSGDAKICIKFIDANLNLDASSNHKLLLPRLYNCRIIVSVMMLNRIEILFFSIMEFMVIRRFSI